MLTNYLTIFLRTLLRQKVYSIINIFGLSVCIAATMLIAIYIRDEVSYDRFHKDAERIVRVSDGIHTDGVESKLALGHRDDAGGIYKEISGVDDYVRFRKRPVTPIEYGPVNVDAKLLILADSNFFSFFSFKLKYGNQKDVLTGPNKIVLTESLARNIFGEKNTYNDLIGKTILLGLTKSATVVTGIAEDPPSNSHFHFDAILSLATNEPMDYGYFSFIKLNRQTTIEDIQAPLQIFSRTKSLSQGND